MSAANMLMAFGEYVPEVILIEDTSNDEQASGFAVSRVAN